ncbi:MAG: hypothetical protein SFX18_11850 [Pirellulales bacterium]|nr:hypothetical protein [Pirellulales bacterium]
MGRFARQAFTAIGCCFPRESWRRLASLAILLAWLPLGLHGAESDSSTPDNTEVTQPEESDSEKQPPKLSTEPGSQPAKPRPKIGHLINSKSHGFIVVNEVAQLQEKLKQTIEILQLPIPEPIEVLKALFQIDEGVDWKRPLIGQIYPGNNGPILILMVPVTSQKAFLENFDVLQTRGKLKEVRLPGGAASGALAEKGNYAVLSEGHNADILERFLKENTRAEQAIKPFEDWISKNDATVVLLKSGILEFTTIFQDFVEAYMKARLESQKTKANELFTKVVIGVTKETIKAVQAECQFLAFAFRIDEESNMGLTIRSLHRANGSISRWSQTYPQTSKLNLNSLPQGPIIFVSEVSYLKEGNFELPEEYYLANALGEDDPDEDAEGQPSSGKNKKKTPAKDDMPSEEPPAGEGDGDTAAGEKDAEQPKAEKPEKPATSPATPKFDENGNPVTEEPEAETPPEESPTEKPATKKPKAKKPADQGEKPAGDSGEEELADEEGVKIPVELAKKFAKVQSEIAKNIRSITLYQGALDSSDDNVYTRTLYAYDVQNAAEFRRLYDELHHLQIQIDEELAGESRFGELEELTIRDKPATQMKIDFDLILRSLPLRPREREVQRKFFERMYGVDLEVDAFWVTWDENTVLYGHDQTFLEDVMAGMEKQQNALSQDAEILPTLEMLPAKHNAILLVNISPMINSYQSMIFEVFIDFIPQLANKLTPPPEFPSSPPLGLTYRVAPTAVECQIVVPGEFLKSAVTYGNDFKEWQDSLTN